MKKRILKGIAFTLVILLVIPLLCFSNVSIASAKPKGKQYHSQKQKQVHNPKVSYTKQTLTNDGETFTLSLSDLGNNVAKISWYTQNHKVATVKATNDSKTAVVTSVRKGTTFIKCKITYKDGTVVRPYCKVTVKIAATNIDISNAYHYKDGYHEIVVGRSYNFNSKLTPRNAQDTTYWFVDKEEYARVNSKGVVTARKPGVVVLTAVAAKTEAGAATSKVKDTIKIKIVDKENYNDHDDDDDDEKTTNVKEVKLIDAKNLTITFDKAIDRNSILTPYFTLLSSVVISPKVDEKGITANPLGYLTANLSDDGKTLTIQAANNFKGLYGIQLNNTIKGTDGIALSAYNEDATLYYTKGQAELLSLVRTSTYTLTATFAMEILTPGWVVFNNNEWVQGVTDAKDLRKVIYTIPAAHTVLTGWQKLSIGYWAGYNAWPETDIIGELTEMYVDFTLNNLLQLPAPIAVNQSQNDNNVVYVQFNTKLDETTAENKTNYSIAGATITSAELTNNVNSATVKLTLQQGSVITSQTYSVIISGIKGYNNSYTTMNPFQTALQLKENTPPTLVTYRYSTPTTITLIFSEPIAGTPIFAVMQNNIDISSYSIISGTTVIINLKSVPTMNMDMQLFPTTNSVITDIAGNKTTSILTRTIFPSLN